MENSTLSVNATFPNGTVFGGVAPVVWPQWVEVTVPLICIVVFIATLIVIFLKPSKPGDDGALYSLVFRAKETDVVFVEEPGKLDSGKNTKQAM